MSIKSSIVQIMRQSASHSNVAIARWMKTSAPYIIIAEFPRSGGNWVRDMLGDALQKPVPRFSMLPVTFDAILQTHSANPIHGPTIVYVVRDGRDVLVSHYHKAVNSVLSGNPALEKRVKKFHPSLNASEDILRSGGRLKEFYKEWKSRSIGSRVGWGAHLDALMGSNNQNLSLVRYEDLQMAPANTLSNLIKDMTDTKPKDYVLDFAIHRNSFAEKTGRAPGDVDNKSNRRSGKPGGWKHELPNELKDLFWADFGANLSHCGYSESGEYIPLVNETVRDTK